MAELLLIEPVRRIGQVDYLKVHLLAHFLTLEYGQLILLRT